MKNDTEPVLTGERGREVLKFALGVMRSAREVYLNEFELQAARRASFTFHFSRSRTVSGG